MFSRHQEQYNFCLTSDSSHEGNPEAYSETCQTSKMEQFANVANG